MIFRFLVSVSALTLGLFAFFPVGAAPAAPPALDAETYQIDGVHSSAMFKIKHMGVSYSYGRFNKISGTVIFDEKDPAKCSIQVEIPADSVDTNSEGRDKHLKSTDFLNVKQFPTMSFKSASAKKSGDKEFEIAGDFTLHGVTKKITVKADFVGSAKDPRGGPKVGFDAVFHIKRSDYDMKNMLDGVGDDVEIRFGIEAGAGKGGR